MKKRVIVYGPFNSLNKLIKFCLKEQEIKCFCLTKISKKFKENVEQNKIEAVIFNCYDDYKGRLCDLKKIAESGIRKIILIENAQMIYLNSKNLKPYSVFDILNPKNRRCSNYLCLERFAEENFKESVIFRVSEIFGPNIDFGLIYDLINGKIKKIADNLIDLIYEGDLIHAIEIGLKNEVTGIFDIAYGESLSISKDILEIYRRLSKKELKISLKKGKADFKCKPENFKFYRWEPLVNFETGLRVIINNQTLKSEV